MTNIAQKTNFFMVIVFAIKLPEYRCIPAAINDGWNKFH
jgi:hypothetical protein